MNEQKELKLKINDSELKGTYANHVGIMHTGEEFILDFISMLPPEAIVNSRIITSPTALKRMYNAIGMNISKYEDRYGEIEVENSSSNDFDENLN